MIQFFVAGTPKEVVERFCQYFCASDEGCWIWRGATTSRGYGNFKLPGRKQTPAHRFSYKIFRGEIPVGLLVCHRCDVRACVNPGHLFLGTAQDNQTDKVLKGRQARGTRNGGGGKLTEGQVKEIRRLRQAGISSIAVGKKFGVAKKTVLSIEHRRIWAFV